MIIDSREFYGLYLKSVIKRWNAHIFTAKMKYAQPTGNHQVFLFLVCLYVCFLCLIWHFQLLPSSLILYQSLYFHSNLAIFMQCRIQRGNPSSLVNPGSKMMEMKGWKNENEVINSKSKKLWLITWKLMTFY